jgi:hypothetical protein
MPKSGLLQPGDIFLLTPRPLRVGRRQGYKTINDLKGARLGVQQNSLECVTVRAPDVDPQRVPVELRPKCALCVAFLQGLPRLKHKE